MTKFYGVTTVNNRGQIVVPKQARIDFEITQGEAIILLMGLLSHSKDAMLLMKAEDWYGIPESDPIKDQKKHKFGGSSKIAQRGQVVIPKMIRQELNIIEGTQILLLSHEKTQSLILAILNENTMGEWANNLIP